MEQQHRFSRLELLVGSAGLARLADASVAVFGLGGVGSFAVEALARAGVGRLTLVDFDDICPTNVNRQLHALTGTIGRAKVQVMAERCRAINPAARIEPVKEFYGPKNADELLGRGLDQVLDCIDSITAKLHLLEQCSLRGLPVISSMGAANKLDPTQVAVADLAETHKCRLARVMRKELRRRGIAGGIKVVYSTEEFRSLAGERGGRGEDGTAGYQQRRVPLGSSSYIPPLFGLMMAGEVIRSLLGED